MSEKLEEYRREIAEIDGQILKLVNARLQRAENIGKVKKQQKLPITDLKVETEVINRSLLLARELGLDEGFVKRLTNVLIAEAVRVQGGTSKGRASFLYDVFEKVKALEAQGEKVIRLEVGEPDLPSPLELKDALRDALYGSSFIGYSSSKGLTELREAIAEDLNQKYGADIEREQVLITHGGKFAIFSAILSLVSPGDHVIIPEPTWPVYGNCVRLAKGRVNTIHTRFDDAWNMDLSEVEAAFSGHPKLFILCSPNNPTGKVFSEKLLHELAQLAERRETYLLADEVYCAYSTAPFKSLLQISDSNTIYINSFSKKYGMMGWRIGYAVSDVKTITRMQRLLQISVTCVSEFIQRAALRALKMRQDPFNDFAKEMRRRVDVACRELDGFPFAYTRPDGGMYVFPKADVGNGFNSYDFAHKLLAMERVAIAPGEAFGDYPEHFRISLGTNVADIQRGIRKIGRAIDRWRKKQ
jgi:aspartate aminotransferase